MPAAESAATSASRPSVRTPVMKATRWPPSSRTSTATRPTRRPVVLTARTSATGIEAWAPEAFRLRSGSHSMLRFVIHRRTSVGLPPGPSGIRAPHPNRRRGAALRSRDWPLRNAARTTTTPTPTPTDAAIQAPVAPARSRNAIQQIEARATANTCPRCVDRKPVHRSLTGRECRIRRQERSEHPMRGLPGAPCDRTAYTASDVTPANAGDQRQRHLLSGRSERPATASVVGRDRQRAKPLCVKSLGLGASKQASGRGAYGCWWSGCG